jgi:hypothetical protein
VPIPLSSARTCRPPSAASRTVTCLDALVMLPTPDLVPE